MSTMTPLTGIIQTNGLSASRLGSARQRPPWIQGDDVEEPHDLPRFGCTGALAHVKERAQITAAQMRLLRGIKQKVDAADAVPDATWPRPAVAAEQG